MKIRHAHAYAFRIITPPDAARRDGIGLLTSFNRFRLYPALIIIEMTRTLGLHVACAVNHDTTHIGLRGLRRLWSSDFNAGKN